MTLSVTIIIPVYNGGATLRACLASVMAADPPAARVIVASDGSTDDSEQIASAAEAQIIRLEHNSGPSRARNLGARATTSDILLFLDDDVTISPGLIGQVTAFFEANPTIDAAFGSYDALPAAPNFTSQYRNLLHHYVHQTSSERAITFWGGCGAIRRAAFDAVGGFPEDRRYLEDIELGYRLTAGGYAIWLCKGWQVKHLKRWTLQSLIVTDIFRRAVPWTALLLEYGQVAGDLNLRLSNRLSLVLVYLIPVLVVCGAIISPWLWASIPIIFMALIILNGDLYRFYWRERGLAFAACVLPWHWLIYYGGSGLGVILGSARWWTRKRRN